MSDTPAELPWTRRQVDGEALELVLAGLDEALDQRRLSVRKATGAHGPVRIVEALGLFSLHVHPLACELRAYSVTPIGKLRRIGGGMPGPGLLAHAFWLRFAFQRWAPQLGGNIDFVESPHSRPGNVELDTSEAALQQLALDARFRTLPAEFDEALAIPAYAQVLSGEQGNYQSVETTSELWRNALRTRVALRSALPS